MQYGLAAGPTILAQFTKAATILNVPNRLKQVATPADPGATYTALYAKSDGNLYFLPTGGAETKLAASTEAAGTTLTGTGDLLTTSAPSTLSRLAIGTAHQALYTNAGATAPTWAPSAKSVLSATGDILYASAANTLARVAIGTARQALTVNTTADGFAYLATLQSLMTATGDTIYASGANTPARLAKGSDGQFLSLQAGIPAWTSSTPAGQATTVAGSTSNPTTVSASYATIPEMSATLTTTGNKLKATLVVSFYNSSATATVTFALSLDGAAEVAVHAFTVSGAAHVKTITVVRLFTGVSAASHTVTGRWLTDSGTATANTTQRELILEELTS